MIKFGGPISTFKTENVKSEADGFSALQSHNPVFKQNKRQDQERIPVTQESQPEMH